MGRSKTIPLETKLKLIEEYKNGESSSVLADRYSVHQTTVLRIIRDKARFEMWAKQQEQHELDEHNDADITNNDQDDIFAEQRKQTGRKKLRSTMLSSSGIVNHHHSIDSSYVRPRTFQNINSSKDVTTTMMMMMKNSSNCPSTISTLTKFSEPYKSRQNHYQHTRNLDLVDNLDFPNHDDDNDEQNRMLAFRKFFEYIDKIEEIVLAYDPEFKEAFKFTRNLNNSSLRYRYLLYELEKKNNDRKQYPIERSTTTTTTIIDHHSNPLEHHNNIAMEFCNLIRTGISRAT